MKKILLTVLFFVLALVIPFAISSCGEEPEALHTHTPGEAVQENFVDSTCTETGSYDEVTYCAECEQEISRTEKTVELKAHTSGEAVTENFVDSTCSELGSYDEVVYCTACGAEISRTKKTVELKAHTSGEAVTENLIDSTCTETGSYDEVVYCIECGQELSRKENTVEIKAHSYVFGSCSACGIEKQPSEGLEYTLSEDETYYAVTGIGTCKDTDIVIPSIFNDLPVTAIGSYAFYNCKSLTSITIPDGVGIPNLHPLKNNGVF